MSLLISPAMTVGLKARHSRRPEAIGGRFTRINDPDASHFAQPPGCMTADACIANAAPPDRSPNNSGVCHQDEDTANQPGLLIATS